MMKKNKSLLVISEETLITKIIKSLRNFLRIKQDKNETSNRTAEVITSEKIDRKYKHYLTQDELISIDEKVLSDSSYIDILDENELSSLDEYYDMKIKELEQTLTDKKSKYFKVMSKRV